MRAITFASRNIKELLRDPLSYIFCLGLPIVMLIVMTVVNSSIPETPALPAGMPVPEGTAMTPTVFRIEKLTPAMAIFGMTFVMLFSCMRVSSDRSGAFLTRLYASPMKGTDYILGYICPFGLIAFAQIIITDISGMIIAAVTGKEMFNILYMLIAIPLSIPSVLLFIGFGILFGVLFNDKVAPGICSAVITAVALLGGIWMDVDQMGGVWLAICNKLPFYHSVRAARLMLAGEYGEMLLPLLITAAFAAVIFGLSVLAFVKKMQSDKK